jgi:hypothetical protein
MSYTTTTRLRNQIVQLHRQEKTDLDFGLGEILPQAELAQILQEEGATWRSILYTRTVDQGVSPRFAPRDMVRDP